MTDAFYDAGRRNKEEPATIWKDMDVRCVFHEINIPVDMAERAKALLGLGRLSEARALLDV